MYSTFFRLKRKINFFIFNNSCFKQFDNYSNVNFIESSDIKILISSNFQQLEFPKDRILLTVGVYFRCWMES